MGTRLTYPVQVVKSTYAKEQAQYLVRVASLFSGVAYYIQYYSKSYEQRKPILGVHHIKGKGDQAWPSLCLFIFLSLLLNDLMGLDNNKKSQGSESSYTLVAGGASASGEGNQMAEKTRIQTSFFKQPLVVCRFIERRRQSFFLTNKIGAPKVRHSIGCSRTYSRSKIASRDVPITHR